MEQLKRGQVSGVQKRRRGVGESLKLERHQKSDQSKPVLVGFIQNTVFFLLFLSNPKRKRKLPDHWLWIWPVHCSRGDYECFRMSVGFSFHGSLHFWSGTPAWSTHLCPTGPYRHLTLQLWTRWFECLSFYLNSKECQGSVGDTKT